MFKRPDKKKTRTVKVCPQCGSGEIYYVAGMVTGQKYKCEGCSYVGSVIFEKDVEVDEMDE